MIADRLLYREDFGASPPPLKYHFRTFLFFFVMSFPPFTLTLRLILPRFHPYRNTEEKTTFLNIL